MFENPMVYTATLDGIADDQLCACQDCDWEGRFDQTLPIDDAVLTPGDPSPAGRCPECATLAYVIPKNEAKMRISVDGGVTWIESKYLCVDINLPTGKSMTLSFEDDGRLQADLWGPQTAFEVCEKTTLMDKEELKLALFP